MDKPRMIGKTLVRKWELIKPTNIDLGYSFDDWLAGKRSTIRNIEISKHEFGWRMTWETVETLEEA